MTDNIESAALLGPKVARFRTQSRAAGRAEWWYATGKVGIDRDKARLERKWLPPILDTYRDYLKLGVPCEDEFADKLRRECYWRSRTYRPARSSRERPTNAPPACSSALRPQNLITSSSTSVAVRTERITTIFVTRSSSSAAS
ncbi:hypothetical protein U5A82_03735 [Sphingobium sp. CR2-8]|uniref:hypothetical protein n=1 Tax=Sphingobium sp. CR2-8 TaxID=1306534 RepID=UPI002DBCCFC5|nr:hypothetical protein [Sphingobium sp. CR2-8]MEC3909612.1 hypothetical protein [Sphingobium sp. CR2-8]